MKKHIVLIIILLLCLSCIPTHANSARTHWTGTSSTGAIITDEECPIVVESENLTFNIQEFPQEYYQDTDSFLSYSSNVSAEYTFYNPTNYKIEATLVFPFGTIPHYGIIDRYNINLDIDKYDVTIDNKPANVTLRHTYLPLGSTFDLTKDLSLLHSSYMKDDFYHPDMQVTRYYYQHQDVDMDKYSAATAAFRIYDKNDERKILFENMNGGALENDYLNVDSWVSDDYYIVDIIGKPLDYDLEWKFYENGACEKEIEGTMVLINKEETTLKDFILSQYNPESKILDYDYYNAMIESFKHNEWEYNVLMLYPTDFDFTDQLMRWYEYDIAIDPMERIINTVNVPLYPSIDSSYDPSIYEYTYLLSPAKTWKNFSNLTITINTPYKLINNSLGKFDITDTGYTTSFSTLPTSELIFTLSTSNTPKQDLNLAYIIPPLAIVVFVLLIILIIYKFIKKMSSFN